MIKPTPHAVYNCLELYDDLRPAQELLGFIQDICECQPAASVSLSAGYRDDHDVNLFPTSASPLSPVMGLYVWVRLNVCIFVAPPFRAWFEAEFNVRDTNVLEYTNLTHLVMIVKNAGPDFERVLETYLQWIDRWTILDTGSTDGTQETVLRVLGGSGKRGHLFEEPFVDFATSRNRCLELAGRSCTFLVMLDDTYQIESAASFRAFLETVRSDQYADSFTLFIQSGDLSYGSNRVLKAHKKLKYVFKIHEVVQENLSVMIPFEVAHIIDHKSAYMNARTKERAALDFRLLQASIEEEPEQPRHLIYMARTFAGQTDYKNAYKYYLRRVFHSVEGFLHEKVDAAFEAARLAHFYLNKPWPECEFLYHKVMELDPARPEPHYFIGCYHYLRGDKRAALPHFARAFKIGYPEYAQYSLKPTLSFYYVPKFLIECCYWVQNWELGECAATFGMERYVQPPDDSDMRAQFANWRALFHMARKVQREPIQFPEKPLFCIVADGNWRAWNGHSLYTAGLGGSETCIVELARHIQSHGQFVVYVFCKTDVNVVVDGVCYVPLEQWFSFISRFLVHTCLINRFSEYLLAAYESHIERVLLMAHDIGFSTEVIPLHNKLQHILALTPFHAQLLQRTYPALAPLIRVFSYGINSALLEAEKAPRAHNTLFIYTSTANRGLLPLLQMWPAILARSGGAARLEIYCDLELPWVKEVYAEGLKDIHALLTPPPVNVEVKGWVSKPQLMAAWLRADVWFYPCIFVETFCLSALEAAATQTFILTSDLGALPDTVGSGGVCLSGDPMTSEWQRTAVDLLFTINREPYIKRALQRARGLIWEARAEEFAAAYLPAQILEHQNMYNWTHDIPPNTRQDFLQVLNELPPDARILEIGSFTGTSIIHMLTVLPKATGLALDAWENYEENGMIRHSSSALTSFLRNRAAAGLESRLQYIKMRSVEGLMALQTQRFDLIYVDGSHHPLDCFTDLTLAWPLVQHGGCMIIDDYLFDAELQCTIDLFLSRLIAREPIEILFKNYRIGLRRAA